MSAAPVQFDIIAEDEASDVFSSVSENFTEMSDTVSSASEQMSSTVTEQMQGVSSSSDEATTEIQTDTSQWESSWDAAASSCQSSMGQIATSNQEAADATNTSSASFGQQAMQMNSAAMSGAMLYMAINNVENAQVTLNRANLMEEKAANAVTLAQQAYNKAVAEYGPMSMQAQDAQNKLALAQQTQALDQERVSEAQRNYNSTLLMSALTVIPAFVNIVGLASTFTDVWTGAQVALDAAMDACPIMLIIAGIAALAIGLYEAYEHITPFRNAINEIGTILKDVFVAAINDVRSAISWLWNELTNNPITWIVTGPIGILLYALTHWNQIVTDVRTGISWLWSELTNNPITWIVTGPVGLLLYAFTHVHEIITDVRTAVSWLWNQLTTNPITWIVTGPIGMLLYALTHIHQIVNDVGLVVQWLWNNCFAPVGSMLMTLYDDVLLPVANFFKTILTDAINTVMKPIDDFEGAMKDVGKVLSPIANAIGDVGGALSKLCFAHAAPAAEEFNKQLTQSLTLSDQLAHRTSTLGSSLQALSGNVKLGGGTGTSTVNIASPNITINGSITGSASLKNVRDAVSKGICDAMFKKGIMNKVA